MRKGLNSIVTNKLIYLCLACLVILMIVGCGSGERAFLVRISTFNRFDNADFYVNIHGSESGTLFESEEESLSITPDITILDDEKVDLTFAQRQFGNLSINTWIDIYNGSALENHLDNCTDFSLIAPIGRDKFILSIDNLPPFSAIQGNIINREEVYNPTAQKLVLSAEANLSSPLIISIRLEDGNAYPIVVKQHEWENLNTVFIKELDFNDIPPSKSISFDMPSTAFWFGTMTGVLDNFHPVSFASDGSFGDKLNFRIPEGIDLTDKLLRCTGFDGDNIYVIKHRDFLNNNEKIRPYEPYFTLGDCTPTTIVANTSKVSDKNLIMATVHYTNGKWTIANLPHDQFTFDLPELPPLFEEKLGRPISLTLTAYDSTSDLKDKARNIKFENQILCPNHTGLRKALNL